MQHTERRVRQTLPQVELYKPVWCAKWPCRGAYTLTAKTHEYGQKDFADAIKLQT